MAASPMVERVLFSLEDYSQDVRARVDRALAEYTALDSGCPDHLREAIRYSLLAPGKRLRPMLVLMAAEACRGNREAALPAACAVEMIHTYSLIHDDLPAMDDDDLRRGRPTCHKAFGEGVAILAGDALLTLAFEVLARDIHPPEVAAECCRVLAQAAGATELVGGQADDLNEQFSSGRLETLESIHRRKTGAMFLVSLRLGAMVAGAGAVERAALDEYGTRLVRGDATAMGKRAGKDSQRGKLTFPGILGVEESVRRARLLVAEARAALNPLGPHAESLLALAHYVLERKH